jgi:hypothetical protein
MFAPQYYDTTAYTLAYTCHWYWHLTHLFASNDLSALPASLRDFWAEYSISKKVNSLSREYDITAGAILPLLIMLYFMYDIFASEAHVVDDPHMVIHETHLTVMYICLEATGWFRCLG